MTNIAQQLNELGERLDEVLPSVYLQLPENIPHRARLIGDLKRHEGVCFAVYKDVYGNLTGGIGHKLVGDEREYYAGLTAEQRSEILWSVSKVVRCLVGDIEIALADVQALFPSVVGIARPARVHALINMAFNMGRPALGTFINMAAAIERGGWVEASEEALDSKWAKKDVPTWRSHEIARQIKTGEFSDGK